MEMFSIKLNGKILGNQILNYVTWKVVLEKLNPMKILRRGKVNKKTPMMMAFLLKEANTQVHHTEEEVQNFPLQLLFIKDLTILPTTEVVQVLDLLPLLVEKIKNQTVLFPTEAVQVLELPLLGDKIKSPTVLPIKAAQVSDHLMHKIKIPGVIQPINIQVLDLPILAHKIEIPGIIHLIIIQARDLPILAHKIKIPGIIHLINIQAPVLQLLKMMSHGAIHTGTGIMKILAPNPSSSNSFHIIHRPFKIKDLEIIYVL